MNRVWASIRLPLGDKSYLQDVNVYIFRSGDGFLMIDAGLNTEPSYNALLQGLDSIGFRINDIRLLLISHYHLDHCGLSLRLQKAFSIPVYLHEADKRILEFFKKHIEHYPEEIWKFYHSYGVSEHTMDFIKKELHVYKALILGPTDTLPLKDGDIFKIQDGYIQAVFTPGHTPGHMSFYYPEEKILFGADFLLNDEWPHGGIYPHTKQYNPIKDYLNSLRKVKEIELEMIMPAHGKPIYEPIKRINDTIKFINNKIDEIYSALKKRPLTLPEICDKAFKAYDSSLSYFFILSLALGYVRYLINEGMAEEIRVNKTILFRSI